MRSRAAAIAVVVLAVAGTAVYVRRKRAAAPPPVKLALDDGSEQSLAAGDPGVAELLSAAAGVRRGFEAGA